MKKLRAWITVFLVLQLMPGQSQTETLGITSKVFNETRKVKVALPQGYNDDPSRKYIVAWLFDAQSGDFFNYIKATIDYLTSQGYIKPLILIGIQSANRQYEFTPASQTAEGLKNFKKSGGASLLALHLKGEVLPEVQKKYRCEAYNIGIGHSLGGTFVTYCLLNFAEIFNASIIVSPNYHYDNEQLVHKFDSLANERILKNRFLYIAYGKGDTYEERFKPGTKKIDSLLHKKNIPGLRWLVKNLDNDDHGTTAAEGIFKGLIELYRQFTLPYTQFTTLLKDTTSPFINRIKQYYKTQSDWAGITLPMVNDANGMAYNCLYSDKPKEAVAILHWALSLYPENINLYDSMGEIQQTTGNNKEALEYYSKGLAIVERQKSRLENNTYQGLIKGFKERIRSVGDIK